MIDYKKKYSKLKKYIQETYQNNGKSLVENIEQDINNVEQNVNVTDLSTQITLIFPVNEFCKSFKINTPDEINDVEYYSEYNIPNEDIEYNTDIEFDDAGDAFDINGNPVSEDVISDIKIAMNNATEAGYKNNLWRDYTSCIEDYFVQNFQDFRYEYGIMYDSYISKSGIAKGIQSISVDGDNVQVVCCLDTAHIINDMLSGVGMFEPSVNIEEESPDNIKQFIQESFPQLRHYGEIYGETSLNRKLESDLQDTQEDFDKEYFKQSLRDMQGELGLVLIKESYSYNQLKKIIKENFESPIEEDEYQLVQHDLDIQQLEQDYLIPNGVTDTYQFYFTKQRDGELLEILGADRPNINDSIELYNANEIASQIYFSDSQSLGLENEFIDSIKESIEYKMLKKIIRENLENEHNVPVYDSLEQFVATMKAANGSSTIEDKNLWSDYGIIVNGINYDLTEYGGGIHNIKSYVEFRDRANDENYIYVQYICPSWNGLKQTQRFRFIDVDYGSQIENYHEPEDTFGTQEY